MPTPNPSLARHNALIIQGLDANPVYLPLYVAAGNRGNFIQLAEFRSIPVSNQWWGCNFPHLSPGARPELGSTHLSSIQCVWQFPVARTQAPVRERPPRPLSR